MEAVHHLRSCRIFHDFTFLSLSRKVAGGYRSQRCISVTSSEPQAEVAKVAGGGNMLGAVHKRSKVGLK